MNEKCEPHQVDFDKIDTPDIQCPNPRCNLILKNFCSNEGPCQGKNIPFYVVNNFYTTCECGTEVQFNKKFFPEVGISDYQIRHDIPPPPQIELKKKGYTLEEDKED